ncbi:phosphate/phosphite/phosphonate ABC transporter substrate-binding protein [Pannonibacter tanglangensis]|uniref:PhnD/SsuA/transferrin family substrate-binding protein n=1 Tax=Pannonibacter tanglangensis TaxID=2750084 RepID=A0ABW9ZII5_9HYPH|nr:PhnD/SsuA/transferrin family substrate-binding protein [Pannonibacter sp. XCT-34]NBN64670.1 PhnD/SsuA/transferrin family substrate-binding protein [Pannonibacter sp. XCT-34]
MTASLRPVIVAVLGLLALPVLGLAEGLTPLVPDAGGLDPSAVGDTGRLPAAGAGAPLSAGQRLRLGVVTGAEEGVRERVEPFREELQYRLAQPVDLFLMDTLGAATDALVRGDIDLMRLSASAYGAAETACACLDPLVVPRDGEGAEGFHAVLVTRAAEAATLAALSGGRLAIGDPAATAAFRMPLAGLAQEGIDPARFFSALVRVEGPREGLRALFDGRVEGALVWSTLIGDPEFGYSAGTLNEAFLSTRLDMDRIAVVWRSPRLPYAVMAARTDLSPALRARLRSVLSTLADDAPGAYFAIEPDFGGGYAVTDAAAVAGTLLPYRPEAQALLTRLARAAAPPPPAMPAAPQVPGQVPGQLPGQLPAEIPQATPLAQP